MFLTYLWYICTTVRRQTYKAIGRYLARLHEACSKAQREKNKTKAKTKPKLKSKCENVKFLVLINPHNRLLIESSAHILQSTFYTPHSTFPVHSSLSCSWVGRAALPHSLALSISLFDERVNSTLYTFRCDTHLGLISISLSLSLASD